MPKHTARTQAKSSFINVYTETKFDGKANSEHAEGVLAWSTLILMEITGILAFVIVTLIQKLIVI